MTVPQKTKIELPYDRVIPLLGIYPEKNMVQKDICTPMFIAAVLRLSRYGSNLSVHQQMNGLRRCGIYIQGNATQQ